MPHRRLARMITRLSGVLESVADGVAVVACGDLAYEVMVPAAEVVVLEPHQVFQFHQDQPIKLQ